MKQPLSQRALARRCDAASGAGARRRGWRVSLALLWSLYACSGAAPTAYQEGAERTYQLAVEALEDEDYISALEQFRTVHTRYVYSRYAPLAEVGEADTEFAQESYSVAIEKYRTFIQKRPNHERVPYAFWRIAESYFLQRPQDNFLFPPTYEKDLSPSRDALRALQAYLQRYPEGEFRSRAEEARLACLETMMAHEYYVADFYLRQDKPAAARSRLERLVATYQAFPERWGEAAWRLTQILEGQEEHEAARRLAARLVEALPEHSAAREARSWLERQGEAEASSSAAVPPLPQEQQRCPQAQQRRPQARQRRPLRSDKLIDRWRERWGRAGEAPGEALGEASGEASGGTPLAARCEGSAERDAQELP